MKLYVMIYAGLVYFAVLLSGHAANRTWTGAVDNDWYNPANWSPAGVPDPADTLNVNGVSPNFSPPFALTGQLNWDGGTLAGGLTVAGAGTVDLLGVIISGPLTNHGRINVQGPVYLWLDGVSHLAELWNQPEGVIDIQGDYQVNGRIGTDFALLHNAGLVVKSAGSGDADLNVRVDNTGTVRSQSGQLVVRGGSELAGGIFEAEAGAALYFTDNHTVTGTVDWRGPGQVGMVNGGYILGSNLTGGTLTMYGGYIIGPLTNHGRINVQGPVYLWLDGVSHLAELWNQPEGVIDIQGDYQVNGRIGTDFALLHNAGLVVKSAGSGDADLNVRVDNTGTCKSSQGTLVFRNEYSGSASSTLAVSLGGTQPGADYGHIHFDLPLALTGAFAAGTRDGFRPAPGDVFQVLSYQSITGDFACFSGLDLGGGLLLTPQFSRAGLSLVTTTYEANTNRPRLFIVRSPGGARVLWPLGFPEWHLESTASLFPADWMPVTATCGNQVLMPAALPQQYFRLSRP